MHWPDAESISMIRVAAERKAGLFAAFPDVSRADLISESVLKVAAARFDPAKSAAPTFAYMVTSRRLIDLYRRRNRQREGDKRFVPRDEAYTPGGDDGPGPGDDLAGWCASVYRAASHAYGEEKLRRIGRSFFRVPQVAAVVLLMDRLKLDDAGTMELLRNRPDVLRALHFFHVPGAEFFKGVRALLERGRGAATPS